MSPNYYQIISIIMINIKHFNFCFIDTHLSWNKDLSLNRANLII